MLDSCMGGFKELLHKQQTNLIIKQKKKIMLNILSNLKLTLDAVVTKAHAKLLSDLSAQLAKVHSGAEAIATS